MLSSGGFTAASFQALAKGGSSRMLPSFRHGLHGSVGIIFFSHVVYVVICYIPIICYMPVICLVQSPPQEPVVVFG
jgi:hypothetical protein